METLNNNKVKINSLTVGKWFKSLRNEEGLTLENLSSMSGLSITTIWRMEDDRNFPSPATVNSLLRLMFSDDNKRFEKEMATYNTLRKRHMLEMSKRNKARLGGK